MLLLCSRCGYPHMPFEVNCHRCTRPMQEEAEAAPARANFESKPEPIRLDLEKIVADARRQYDEHSERLRRERWIHTSLGALCMVVGMRGILPLMLGFIPVDAALGAAAAFWLNHRRAGRFTGLFTFMGCVCVLLLLRTTVISYGRAIALVMGLSGLFAGVCGFALGMRTEFRGHDL